MRFDSADQARNRRPTSVEPVKATQSTSGCRPIAAPTESPGPVTTLRTPSGMPASAPSSASRSKLSDVVDAGLMTTLLPVASAGPSFHAAIWAG